MRKIIEYCLVSADGIMLDDPFPFGDYLDEAYLRDRLGLFTACGAILWGRTTYERFAERWTPGTEANGPYAARLHAMPKYVFTPRLERAEWNNSIIVRGHVATEVTRLKEQDGGDLLVLGHGLLSETYSSAVWSMCSTSQSIPSGLGKADQSSGRINPQTLGSREPRFSPKPSR